MTVGQRLLRKWIGGLIALTGCGHVGAPPSISAVAPVATPAPVPAVAWTGVYTSPAEIRGFESTVLCITSQRGTSVYCRTTRSSDTDFTDGSDRAERKFPASVDAEHLYLPLYVSDPVAKDVTGAYFRSKRYTRRTVNGRDVLFDDGALAAFEGKNRLYDYGILIKVGDNATFATRMAMQRHESIKVLYNDAGNDWHDPFVHGPNPR